MTVGGLLAEVVRDGLRERPVLDRRDNRLIFVFKGPRGPVHTALDQVAMRDIGRMSDAIDQLFNRVYDRLEAEPGGQAAAGEGGGSASRL